jgi:hypothetical protein
MHFKAIDHIAAMQPGAHFSTEFVSLASNVRMPRKQRKGLIKAISEQDCPLNPQIKVP